VNPLIRRPLLAGAGAAACILVQLPLHANEFQQHGVHEHGTVEIDIVAESGKLSLEIRAPAINVVGFEHSPRTAQERAAAAGAIAMLKSASGFVGAPPEARCRLASSQASPPAWDEDDHDHDDHAAEDDHDAHEHMEYSARLSYLCDAAPKLEWLELWVLGKLKNVREARVNVITPEGQHSQRVRAPSERVPLQGPRR
jgi:hypothetical protein